MKVYVLTIEQVWDYSEINLSTEVYYTSEDARAALKRWRDDEIETVEENEWDIETDNEDQFLAYEEGCFSKNHSQAIISECEVIGKKPPFFERYAELKREEIECLRVALAKAGGSYRFENAFIKVIAALGGFTEDYEFCIVRSAELNDDGRITIEVEANYQTYDIDAGDILENQIHYITEEIEA